MFLSDLGSFISAMLFAVHPIHTEAVSKNKILKLMIAAEFIYLSFYSKNFKQVTGVVGRAETLSSLFYLAALITYTKCCKSKRSTGELNFINAKLPPRLIFKFALYFVKRNLNKLSKQTIFSFILGWQSLLLSMFFVFVAMLCKEQGITATAVCVLYEIFVVQRVIEILLCEYNIRNVQYVMHFVCMHEYYPSRCNFIFKYSIFL